MKSIVYVGMDVHKNTFNLCAIYAKTGNSGVLYQVRYIENMLQNNVDIVNEIRNEIKEKSLKDRYSDMFRPQYHFLRGEEMSGVLVGGNVRCLLKLADTEYFPDVTDKILFIEARSGLEKEMRGYLNQLQQMGVFEKINGLFLGTFTRWDEEKKQMTMERLVMEYLPKDLPVAKTLEVGHAKNSKALRIGKHLRLVVDGVLEYI